MRAVTDARQDHRLVYVVLLDVAVIAYPLVLAALLVSAA